MFMFFIYTPILAVGLARQERGGCVLLTPAIIRRRIFILSNTELKSDSFKLRPKNAGWLCRARRRRKYISESTHYFNTKELKEYRVI